MLQSLLAGLATAPLDVQIWDCVPLVVEGAPGQILYGQTTQIEFTPFGEQASLVGHAIALKANDLGVVPEISIDMRQYIDNPIELGRRQGIILSGSDAAGVSVTWYINGAADRYLTSDAVEPMEYDEETAKILEQELANEDLHKLNLNSYL